MRLLAPIGVFLPVLAFLAALTGCATGDGSTIAGTGSQTGNTVVAGFILDSNASPVPGAHVSIRPLDWTASSTAWAGNCLRDTVTDSFGRYRFPNLPQGTYRILSTTHSGTSLLGVHAGTDSILSANSALSQPATLKGEIDLNDTTRGGRVEIYGVARSTTLPDTGSETSFTLDKLPAGNLTLRLWSNRFQRVVLEIPVTLLPGKTTTINDEQWSRNPSGPEDVY